MSRIELAKIPALTFYKDALTAARRTSALPQLVCVGKPCKLFQPEVVRCVNLGGSGTDVDWKCEADLPEALRFGKVEVSCEGFSKPGDSYVLKGSCSLEYRLVQVPGSLLKTDTPLFNPKGYDWPSILFSVLWLAVLAAIIYSFLQSCLRSNSSQRPPRPTSNNSSPGGGGSGWFPGDYRDDQSNPPPPYSKNAQNPPAYGWQNWQPGFWTGAALGGIANHVWNRPRSQPAQQAPSYDWERSRSQPRPSFFGNGYRTAANRFDDDDRGEGSSNLGSMRRSTGLGGSNVR